MAEDWQVVNAKDEKVHQSCNARLIDVVLASEVALQGGQASLIPERSYVKGRRMYQTEQQGTDNHPTCAKH